ncbi:unnamed protein product [Somion occarium]
MDERVLQHVLEDVRYRIPEKLANEANVHVGPGGPANAKKGTLDVHRGDTYQFGYFLRKTDPHAVLIKTRNFVAAPLNAPQATLPPQPSSSKPAAASRRRPVPLLKRVAQKRKAQLPTKPAKKRKTKGKGRARDSDFEEEKEEDYDVIVVSSEDEDVEDINIPSGPLRRSARKRGQPVGGYREDLNDDQAGEEEDDIQIMDTAADIQAPSPTAGISTPGEDQDMIPIDQPAPSMDDTGLIAMDESEQPITVTIKAEDSEPGSPFLHPSTPTATLPRDPDIPPGPGEMSEEPPIDLTTEEEEDIKPKPILKLSYEGFNVSGRCLCVIVEPYPPLPARREVCLTPTGLVAPRAPSIALADYVLSGGPEQRARTPLFLPDYDERERSQTPAPFLREKTRPPVPLFYDEAEGEEDEELGGGMYALSQVIQSVGDNPAVAAEDDDEIEGAVFFGDADEAKEL